MEKKKIKASERIDQIITALLFPMIANHLTTGSWINKFPKQFQQHSGKIIGPLFASKFIVTLWRMYLHDLYVGGNPLKLIPAITYFTLVDLASWRWK